MGLRNWAKKHLSVRLDSHTLGNLAKNLAPAAAFTPAGVVGAGLLGTVGELGRGKNIGEAAKAGLSSAAQGAGATSVAGHFGVGPGTHLGFGLGGGSPAAATTPPTGGGIPIPPDANLTGAQIPTGSTFGIPGPGGSGLGHSLASKAGGVLDWASEHPNAAAGALQGIGNLATSGAQNRTANAQADLLQKQAEETEYDFQRRKARDAQLAPIWSSLGSSFGGEIARNPYLPAGA